MSRRTIAIAAALSVLALGSPLITGCTNPLGILYLNQGVEKYEAKNYQGAIDDFTKAVELRSRDAFSYRNRGNAKHKLKDYQGAIADFNTSIVINPEDLYAFNERGRVKYDINDMKGACADFKKAVSLGNKTTMEWFDSERSAWCRNMK